MISQEMTENHKNKKSIKYKNKNCTLKKET